MDEFEKIAALVKKSLIEELSIKRPSLAYNGTPKPVKGKYPPPPPSAPIASGDLIRNITVTFQATANDFALVVEMPKQYYWIDVGRRPSPGRMPPLAAMKTWASQKKVGQYRDAKGRFISNDLRAFLIGKSISEYGYKGTDFINKAMNKSIKTIEDEMGAAAAAYFQNLIDDNKLIVIEE